MNEAIAINLVCFTVLAVSLICTMVMIGRSLIDERKRAQHALSNHRAEDGPLSS